MPRAKKGTQPPGAANAQTYGMAGAQMEAQAEMPLPQAPGPGDTPSGTAAPAPPPPPAAQSAAPVDPITQAIGPAAAISQLPTGLGAPSQRPDENVTMGVPGTAYGTAGQMVAAKGRDSTVDALEQLALVTGQKKFAELAARARAQHEGRPTRG